MTHAARWPLRRARHDIHMSVRRLERHLSRATYSHIDLPTKQPMCAVYSNCRQKPTDDLKFLPSFMINNPA
eukprot:3300207-Pleurochrysis_carterae.AAC.1